jgi:hypothetical protein
MMVRAGAAALALSVLAPGLNAAATAAAPSGTPAAQAQALHEIAALQQLKHDLTPRERKLDSGLAIEARRRAGASRSTSRPRRPGRPCRAGCAPWAPPS